jgi:glycosyltransferase involved in cell wall biosynthesis
MTDKSLIFIVAYNAESHIRSVLDRLPGEVFNNSKFHILIIDDCSKDETSRVASAHAAERRYENVTVMRNTINMGYGGNQKIGYRYAVQNGFGLVILLHGDGQYAPELVLEFVKKWKDDKADVVLGSRMLDKAKARKGGMPFYKWIGNQVLTGFQNRVLGSKLSEFHTGYRAYDTRLLSRLPFELNTNDFHFDTEILLQAFAVEAKFVEFAIPTHYGDEICHVNGMKYAWDVVRACLKFRFQKIGFFCSMQYNGLLRAREDRAGSVQFRAVERLKKPGKVLNLGRTSPLLDKKLDELGCVVTNVTPEFEPQTLTEDVSKYDYVLVLDKIERLTDVERFLVNCRYSMSGPSSPTFIFSTGNVAFIGLRILLGLGLFNYGERGILRPNNKRLFTLSSFRRMLREAGYTPGKVRGVGIPFDQLLGNRFGRAMGWLSDRVARIWPSMFAYHFIIEAQPRPHSFQLLTSAERFYDSSKQVRTI